VDQVMQSKQHTYITHTTGLQVQLRQHHVHNHMLTTFERRRHSSDIRVFGSAFVSLGPEPVAAGHHSTHVCMLHPATCLPRAPIHDQVRTPRVAAAGWHQLDRHGIALAQHTPCCG
jgi:hypothetical protein